MGYTPADEFGTVVLNSKETAVQVLLYGFDIPVHFCSAPYKDSVQLRKRLIRRGEKTAREFEVLTDDGTFVVGILMVPELDLLLFEKEMEKHDVPKDLFSYSTEHQRVEIAPWVLEELSTELAWDSFIIEVYASVDRLEVEREKLPGLK